MQNDMPKIKDGEEYAFRTKTPEEKAAWDAQEIPEYAIKIELNDEQKTRLTEQVFMEFEALKQERSDLKLDKAWVERDKQYDGQLAPVRNIEFAIDVRESKIKVDSIVRAMMEAFFPDDGDIVEVSPRPETSKRVDGYEIAERQQQFLDYAMDEEIKPELAFRKVFLSSAKKFVGIIKQCWSYKSAVRRREEHWEGKIVDTGTVDPKTGLAIKTNEGLQRFLDAYPDAAEKYPAQVKRLLMGKSVDIVVAYKEQIRNNPEYKYVKVEDFYVSNSCEYNEGLSTEHLIGERQEYTYWELKELEGKGEFESVDDMFNAKQDGQEDKGGNEFKTQKYNVMEFTTMFRLNRDDKEETKIKCWFGEDRKVFLACEQYPYYAIDCDYTGFWMTTNDKGFYGGAESLMYDLRDTHLAQDVLISLVLHATYIRNIITPIVREGSEIEETFIDRRFRMGDPIPVDDLTDDVSKAFDFIQWPVGDMNAALIMLEKLKRIGSDVSRVSDMTTGGESQIDPSAPASKTIALLQQSGLGIKDYIKSILPSFDLTAGNLLLLYYQMNTEDRQYRVRQKSKQVTGKDIFAGIKREEMVVKTNVQSRAAAFVFDKVNEKREALAAYQTVNADTYAAQNPGVKHKALKILLSTFGGRWKTMADVDLLSPEEFEERQMVVAVKALAVLMEQARANAEVTGVPVNPQEILEKSPGVITSAQMIDYDPKLAEEVTA